MITEDIQSATVLLRQREENRAELVGDLIQDLSRVDTQRIHITKSVYSTMENRLLLIETLENKGYTVEYRPDELIVSLPDLPELTEY